MTDTAPKAVAACADDGDAQCAGRRRRPMRGTTATPNARDDGDARCARPARGSDPCMVTLSARVRTRADSCLAEDAWPSSFIVTTTQAWREWCRGCCCP